MEIDLEDLRLGGVVVPADVEVIIELLYALSDRAREHQQRSYHMILAMGAESLADNLEAITGADDE